MFIPSTFKRPVSSWKALNLRKTLLMASSVRLKPLNCSRLPCVYTQGGSAGMPRSEERFSRNAETDLVCRLLLEKKNPKFLRAKWPWSLAVLFLVFFSGTIHVHSDTTCTFVNQGNCSITVVYSTHSLWYP